MSAATSMMEEAVRSRSQCARHFSRDGWPRRVERVSTRRIRPREKGAYVRRIRRLLPDRRGWTDDIIPLGLVRDDDGHGAKEANPIRPVTLRRPCLNTLGPLHSSPSSRSDRIISHPRRNTTPTHNPTQCPKPNPCCRPPSARTSPQRARSSPTSPPRDPAFKSRNASVRSRPARCPRRSKSRA